MASKKTAKKADASYAEETKEIVEMSESQTIDDLVSDAVSTDPFQNENNFSLFSFGSYENQPTYYRKGDIQMSAGYMYSVNTTAQSVAVGETINMGSAIRRFGCVRGTATPYANTTGISTVLSADGRCPAYFDVDATFVVVPTAAGTATITALQDGVPIPGATASATVAAAATSVTLPVSFGVRLNSGVTSSNITYVLTGAASSITNVSQTVSKE